MESQPGAALFRAIYEQSPIGIEIYDALGCLVELNQACLDMFGVVDAAELRQFQLFDDPNIPSAFKNSLRAGLPVRYRAPFDFEPVKARQLYRTSRSGTIWLDVFISPIKDELDQVSGYMAQVQDISLRKRMEAELLRESRHYALLMQTSRDAIHVIDRQGRLTDWNDAFLAHLGYTPQEAAALNVVDWEAQWDKEGFTRQFDALITQPGTFETRHRRKDGAILDVEITAAGFELDGQPVLYASARDITERKRSQEAQRISEARFRALFEQAHDAVFVIGLDGHFLMANQRAADLFGYTLDELAQLSFSQLSAQLDHSQNVHNSLLSGEHVPLYERLFRKKDGQLFPTEVNVELVRDGNGAPVHIQSVVRDISQRKQAEKQLTSANEQLHFRVAEVEQLQSELRELALHDPLTGLYNRRFLREALPREIARAEREQQPLSVMICDIDHFKTINDTYGHQVGDQFLTAIANLMKRCIRGSDIVCRYGGEEFVLVLPGASVAAAQNRAEEIRRKCALTVVEHAGQDLCVTLSFGVATYPIHGSQAEEITIKADKALYHSKNTGRNRVSIWDAELTL